MYIYILCVRYIASFTIDVRDLTWTRKHFINLFLDILSIADIVNHDHAK